MEDLHLSCEFLRSITWGDRNPGDLVPLALRHLVALCPRCQAEVDAFIREVRAQGEEPADYAEAIARALARAQHFAEQVAEEREEAAALLGELRRLKPGGRLAAVEGSPERYRGPALAQLLLEETLGCLPGRPQEALSTAQLARAVLRHAETSPIASELFARATAHAGNALRALGRLAEADEALKDARFLLRQGGGGDRRLSAELDSFEGSLRRDERRLPEALTLLHRALVAYRLEEDKVCVIQTLLKVGMVHREMGEIDEAIAATREALEASNAEEHPRLHLYARHNLAYLLCEVGGYTAARRLVDESLGLYSLADALTQLRFLWLEGRIAQGLGQVETAEGSYRAARGGFAREGLAYDVALISLDLATLYLELRRTAEVKALAEEMVGIFEAREIHREALAALLLFRDAARLEQLTLELLRDLSSYLHAARHNPGLSFQPHQ